MLIPESQVRIWLYAPPTDMRKSFDGLSALVRTKLAEDPLSGQLFVFINRRRTQLKVLYFDRGGYCVWAKRLEQGRFHPIGEGEKRRLEWTC
jgi:transposase